MKTKYHNAFYWQNLIKTRRLPEVLNYTPITAHSCFFHGIIYNTAGQRTIVEDILHFPSLDACTGYLQHIYLPMAFFSFTNQKNGIALPIDFSLNELIDYISTNVFIQYEQYLQPMKEIARLMEPLCQKKLEASEIRQQLDKIELLFAQHFHHNPEAYAFFHLFYTPEELGSHFSQLYTIDGHSDLGEKFFHSRTGMNFDEWQALYRQADSNIFAGRKLMNTLQYLRHG